MLVHSSDMAKRQTATSVDFEERGRADKVWKMERRAKRMGLTADKLRAFTDGQWETLAVLCGKRVPSERTRTMVIGVMSERPGT